MGISIPFGAWSDVARRQHGGRAGRSGKAARCSPEPTPAEHELNASERASIGYFKEYSDTCAADGCDACSRDGHIANYIQRYCLYQSECVCIIDRRNAGAPEADAIRALERRRPKSRHQKVIR